MGLSTQRRRERGEKRRESRFSRPDESICGGSRAPNASLFVGVLAACLCVLVNSEFPRRSECTRECILARGRQANMRVSHLSPAARNGQENLRRLLHKGRLLLQGEHQISIAPLLARRAKRISGLTRKAGKPAWEYSSTPQAQGNRCEISPRGHVATLMHQRYLTKKSPSCARIDRLKPAPPRALWADHPHTRIIKGNLESLGADNRSLKTRERRAVGRLPIAAGWHPAPTLDAADLMNPARVTGSSHEWIWPIAP